MSTADEVLDATTYVVVIDYPSTDVPETLVRGGFLVISHDGPTDNDYNVWIIENDVVSHRPLDHVPSGADLVYTYRPLAELQGIAELAQRWGAKAIWFQRSEPDEAGVARTTVENAGLTFIDSPDIREAVRARSGHG